MFFGGETLSGPLANVIVRNWGILVTTVGVLLIYGVFHPEYRSLILTIASITKTAFIVLVISNGFLEVSILTIAVDSSVVLISIFYLFYLQR